MLSLYRRKYITMLAKLFLFVFSFAWILCNSHYPLSETVSGSHSTSSHSTHQEDSTHNSSCLDHTYQISSRNQGNSVLGDLDLTSVVTAWFSFDLSSNNVLYDSSPVYISQNISQRDLFLENNVLRL